MKKLRKTVVAQKCGSGVYDLNGFIQKRYFSINGNPGGRKNFRKGGYLEPPFPG